MDMRDIYQTGRRVGRTIRGGLEKAVVIGGVSVAALGLSPYSSRADVVVKTVPDPECVADGVSECGVKFIIDTTDQDVSDKKIAWVNWSVYFPDQVEFSAAGLPDNKNNPGEVESGAFYTFLMQCDPGCIFNSVGELTTGGPPGWEQRITPGIRETFNFVTGPENIDNKEVAIYSGIVPEGTPQGPHNFLATCIVGDTLGNIYRISNGNLTIENFPFNIVEPNTPSHQFEGFLDCYSGPGESHAGEGCAVYDFDQDGDVDFHDFAEFQRTVSE